MTAHHFGDNSPWVPSRAWADAWVAGAAEAWPLAVADYRARVRDYHADRLVENSQHFPLMQQLEIVIVVTMSQSWAFARVAGQEGDDSDLSVMVRIDERWEDPALSDYQFRHAPNQEDQVRTLAGLLYDEWFLVEADKNLDQLIIGTDAHKSDGSPNPFDRWRVDYLSRTKGWELADLDARKHDFVSSLDRIVGKSIDRSALLRLRGELVRLEQMIEANDRGRALEPFMQAVLQAHGATVERGKGREGEQVDLFVHRPFRALVECRWSKPPVKRPAITELIAKLRRDRPVVVMGIYVSMTGFTSSAIEEARQYSQSRTVLLLNRSDVEILLVGSQHLQDLIDERIDEIVRRY